MKIANEKLHAYMRDALAGFVFVPLACFAVYTTIMLALAPSAIGIGQAVIYVGLVALIVLHKHLGVECNVGELTWQRLIAVLIGACAFLITATSYYGFDTHHNFYFHRNYGLESGGDMRFMMGDYSDNTPMMQGWQRDVRY